MQTTWLDTPGGGLPAGLHWRDAHDGDLPFLRALYADVRAPELAATGWPVAMQETFLDSQFVLQHRHYTALEQPANYLVVEQAARPIGRLYLQRDTRDVRVIDISLLATSRGYGIGSILLQQVQQATARNGLASVMLHVERQNVAAHRLYERLGFTLESDIGSHLRLRWRAPPFS